ncbi:gliding motility-associated C-terminal domain-containing protein, partial [Flavobacterium aquidurense]|uniref:gliding motility-associated C-terminal domain-containing protein n=1 Tax=Flavobacterium aquidurense TaxID=362413 RepID=UPI000B06F81A
AVTVNTTPAKPLLSSVTQQTCAVATGSFTITNYDAGYTYVISPSAGVNQTGNTITAPAGSYTIIAKVNNCESLSSSAVIDSKICANEDNTYPAQTSATTTTTVGNVTSNDTLNGLPVTSADTNVTPITNGPLSIDANGELTLDPNTKSGTYTITYTICEEGANPINCASNTATVIVENTIVANVDNTYPSQTASATTTTIGNVTSNDTLNGLPITSANTNVTPITNGPLSIDANGELTLDPNTKSGTYTITYTICEEGANPVNCASNTATVVVENTIVANVDNTYPAQTASTTTTTIGNVTTNDTLNGLPVTAANTNVTPITNGPLSIDANGELTLDPNTKSGTYTITYTICEEGANPVNCASNTATVVVENTIVANVDNTYPAQPSATTITTVGNVTSNDTLNGLPVTSANTSVTPITNGPLSIDANGELTLDPNTKSGTYTITYTICEEGANPVNCASNTATVVVENTIVANVDNTYPAQTSSATTIGNVTSNDTLNGLPVTSVNTNVTPITNGPLSIDANGELTLDPNTKSGTYTITYTICEEGANPVNCASNTATVVVENTIIATVDNTYPAQPSATTITTIGNVTSNDTLNGLPVTSANTNVTPITNGPLSIDANGELTLDPNTKSGTYTITYTICEEGANPVNCASNTATVVVENTLVATVDNTYPAQTSATTTTTIGNVTSNDTLNGLPVTAANTSVTPITNGPLSIDANGELTLDPNTKSGTYTITYTICEEGANPVNCASNTATVVVGNGIINAVTENTLPINGSIGGTTLSLINNDTLNGNPAIISNTPGGVILKPVNVPTGLILNSDGTITVSAGTPIGIYEVEYSICEYLNQTNCSTVKSYIPVTGAVLQANNDNAGTVDSNKGQSSSTNIFSNDTLNGVALNPATVVLTTVVSNPNLILKADGTIEVKPGTLPGNYELTYQICELLNSSNCSQAVVKIKVVNIVEANPPTAPLTQIVLNNEGVVNVDGINGSLEFINVLDNDLLKGLPINSSDVVITNTPKNNYFEFNADGTVNVKPNTPGGNYSLIYQVCEKSNSGNCATATLNVFVEVPAIAIIKTAVFNDENASGYANAGETITYKFKVTNTGNVPLRRVMVSDPLPGVIVSGQAIDLEINESDENNFTGTYKITQSDINKGSVSNQASVKAVSDKGVVVEDMSDDENNTGDKPTVLPLNGCVIKVFNAFSPNGDEKNTRFYIQGLECYPDNTVEIYNRWGVLVYDIDKYNNEDRAFKGFSEGRTTVKQADGLPVGTYFYILKYKDSGSNSHEMSGYLYINK